MSSALALVVPCSSTVGQHGQSGLGAARRRRPGAAGQRATADHRVATFSPFLSFLRQSTHLPRGTCSWVGLEPASFYPLTGSHAFFRCQLCQPKSLHAGGISGPGPKAPRSHPHRGTSQFRVGGWGGSASTPYSIFSTALQG